MDKKISVIFFGTPEFAVPSLCALAQDARFEISAAVTQPDKPAGRGKKLTPSQVKVAAKELGLEVLQPKPLSLPPLIADLFVVVAYGEILPDEILEIPKYGTINIHPSLLPKYRGPSPIQTAILNGDKETGISIIKLEPGPVDSGPIVLQKKYTIPDRSTHLSLSEELALEASKLLPDAIFGLIGGKIALKEQDHKKATYTKRLKKEDGEIDWSKDVLEIDRQIRAFTPWPGAFTKFHGKRLKILKAHPDGNNLPKDALTMTCSTGALVIDEVQLEGKKPISGKEFASNYLSRSNLNTALFLLPKNQDICQT